MANTAVHALRQAVKTLLEADSGAGGLFDSSDTDGLQRIQKVIYESQPGAAPKAGYVVLKARERDGKGVVNTAAGVQVVELEIDILIVCPDDQDPQRRGHDKLDAIAQGIRDVLWGTTPSAALGWTFSQLTLTTGQPLQSQRDESQRLERYACTATDGGFSLLAAVGMSIEGATAEGDAFSVVLPFGISLQQRIELHEVTRIRDDDKRFTVGDRFQACTIAFDIRAGSDPPQIPVGRKLTTLNIRLKDPDMVLALGTGGYAHIDAMDSSADAKTGRSTGLYSLRWSGAISPSFGPTYADGEDE